MEWRRHVNFSSGFLSESLLLYVRVCFYFFNFTSSGTGFRSRNGMIWKASRINYYWKTTMETTCRFSPGFLSESRLLYVRVCIYLFNFTSSGTGFGSGNGIIWKARINYSRKTTCEFSLWVCSRTPRPGEGAPPLARELGPAAPASPS